ncbi:MAG TPA: EAL domain-containing protein [Anaerolineaceae bacterium]|nr:EAL domain-containing protein [Anaerolineaceae bacterium]
MPFLASLSQSFVSAGNHQLQYILTGFLLLGSAYCAYLAFISWKQRPSTPARLYSILLLSIVFYAVGYALELWSTDLEAMLRSIRIEYLGVAGTPAAWLGIGLYYTNKTYWEKPQHLLSLWIIPLATITAVYTNTYHHLFYASTAISLAGPFPALSFTRGPFYWIHMAYSFGSCLSVTVLLAHQYYLPYPLYRRQIRLMLIASLTTIFFTGLHVLGLTPIQGLDIIPFAFIVSSLIIGGGILNYHLVELTPIARERLFTHQPDGVMVVDGQLRLVDYNPAAARLFDLNKHSIGLALSQILPAEVLADLDGLPENSPVCEVQLKKPAPRFFELARVSLDGRRFQRLVGTLIVFHEITRIKEAQLALEVLNQELEMRIEQQKKTEQALRASQDDYRLLAENSSDVIWRLDLSGRFTYISPAVTRLLGFTPEEIMDMSLKEAVCPGSLGAVTEGLQRAFVSGANDLSLSPDYIEIEQPCKGGGTVWTEANTQLIFSEDGNPVGYVGVSRDISERKLAEEQLRYDATHDVLTGLPNRFLFTDRVERAIERSGNQADGLFSVLFLDLDDFKVINDSLSHSVGDQLLTAIAGRITECLRSCDMVARLGGDEFVILLEDIQYSEDARMIASRILEELRYPFHLGSHPVFITASIGIVLSVDGYEKPEGVLQDADIAMYRAKALGKDRYEFFDPKLRQKAISRLEIENDLRQALEQQSFLLHYQPIYSLERNSIIGFEALLRWDDPKYRLTSPAEVIPIAEETGLILGIGKWVIREACRQVRKWQEAFPQDPPLEINVNISAKQFYEPDFVDQIESEIREAGISPQSLILEITETVFLDNASLASTVFSRLCRLGVRLQMDDFGTGYSSLGYIHHFPIHTIKIDQSFIRELGGTGKNSELVRAMIAMARDLGMETVAEGIETEAQLEELKQFGCMYGQGYLFSVPLAGKSVETMLKERQRSWGIPREVGSTALER